jgi:hypothetical protein
MHHEQRLHYLTDHLTPLVCRALCAREIRQESGENVIYMLPLSLSECCFIAEVLLEQPRARRAEGLGRTTKQLAASVTMVSLSLSLRITIVVRIIPPLSGS